MLKDSLTTPKRKSKNWKNCNTKYLLVYLNSHHPPPTVVRIRGNKDWKDKGVVIEKTKYPRSYVVENQRGNRVRRNRRHLIPTMEEMKYEVESDEDTVVYDSPVVENQLLEGRADAEAAVEQQVDFNLEDKRAASTTTRSGRTSKIPSRYKDYV